MNPILQKTKDEMMVWAKNLDEADKQEGGNKNIVIGVKKTVTAGLIILFDKKTHQNMEIIKNPESRRNPVKTLSTGITGLGWLLFMESKQQMPYEVLIIAGEILMCEVYDFFERSFGFKIDEQMVSKTTRKLAENLMERLGVDPDMLNKQIETGAEEIRQYRANGKAPQQNLPQNDPAMNPGVA